MTSQAKTIDDYLAQVPPERLPFFEKLRQTCLENLPEEFAEEMSYGMIGYVVPKSIYAAGYHCDPKLPLPFVSIASQKNFVALYHMGLYADVELLDWFKNEWPRRTKTKLDMGKSCLRFSKPEAIPFEFLGEVLRKMTVEKWIEIYETAIKKG